MEPQFIDLDIIDMFPHDHPLLDKDLMNEQAKQMSRKLDEFLKSPFITEKRKDPKPGTEQVGDDKDDKQKIEIYDRIHAYVFVFDSSNKKTFDNMMCVIETILELIKSKQRSA